MRAFLNKFILLGLFIMLSAGCEQSVCENPKTPCSTSWSIDGNKQRLSLTDTHPFTLSISDPASIYPLRFSTPPILTRMWLDHESFDYPTAQLATPVPNQLEISLDPSVKNQLRGGQIRFEVVVNNYWQGKMADHCRLIVPPKLTALPPYIYKSADQTKPIALEITTLIGDSTPALFVTETNQFNKRQLSRYDLSHSMLVKDSSFSWLSNAPTDSFLTIIEDSLNVGIAYNVGDGLFAILPMAPLIFAPKNIPDSTFVPVLGIHAIPQTQNYFMVGGTASTLAVQSFAYHSKSTPTPFHAMTSQVFTPNLNLFASRSVSVPRKVDLDASRAFDAIVLDKQNQVMLLRHEALPSQDDIRVAHHATQAFSATLGKTPASAISLADLDDDGLQDIIVAQGKTGSLLWAAQLEDGTFLPAQPIGEILQNVQALAVGDLDGDGLLDIAVTMRDRLIVFRNSARD